jgi:hypothetical protein
MRWLVPVMPLLLLYFGLWIDRIRVTRWLWVVVLSAFMVSCFNVQYGLTSPFQFSVWHNWLENAPNRNRVGKVFNVRQPKRRLTHKKLKAREPVGREPFATGRASTAAEVERHRGNALALIGWL